MNITFIYSLPFNFLLVLLFAVLILGFCFSNSTHAQFLNLLLKRYVLFGLFLSFYLVCFLFYIQLGNSTVPYLFYSLFKLDVFVLFVQLLLLFFAILFIVFTNGYDTDLKTNSYEFLILFLLFLLGALSLVAANDFISIYLGLELQSIPLYMLIASPRNSKFSLEAALKYFILSVFSSSILLFGFGLVYFVSGCLNLSDLHAFNSLMAHNLFLTSKPFYKFYTILFLVGLILIIASFCFKLAAAPFHFWTPDVYDGAPVSVVLLLSTLPKFSAFIAFSHLLLGAFAPFTPFWSIVLFSLGLLSLIVGTLGAFYFNNLSKIIAFGSTAHIGFVLLALSSGWDDAVFLSFYYFLTYLIASFLFFGVWLSFKTKTYPRYVEDFTGLFYVSKPSSFFMIFGLFSFAGIPPFMGFIGKLLVLKGILFNYSTGFALIIFIISVLSAVYYLRVIKFIFFKKPKLDLTVLTIVNPFSKFLFVILAILLVVCAFFIYI